MAPLAAAFKSTAEAVQSVSAKRRPVQVQLALQQEQTQKALAVCSELEERVRRRRLAKQAEKMMLAKHAAQLEHMLERWRVAELVDQMNRQLKLNVELQRRWKGGNRGGYKKVAKVGQRRWLMLGLERLLLRC